MTDASANALAGRPPRAAAARGLLSARAFSLSILLTCLLLQRFALPAGGSLQISFATPIGLGLGIWGLLSRTLILDRRRAAWFAGLLGVAMLATAVQVSLPLAIAPRASLPSLLYWLAITAFAMLRFRDPMDEKAFWRLVSQCLGLVAIAGLLQFVLQFGGVSLFRFGGLMPSRLLIEDQYNLVIPLGTGSLLKSNGFFLVEPSVFSQFMAVAIIIEVLYFRRVWGFVLFFAALFCSASGTGWLVLASFILVLGFSSGLRGLLGAILLVGGCALALAVISLVLPAVGDALLGRTGELSQPGSSGYDRFVTPIMALQAVLHAAPWTFFTGVGPGGSTQLSVPFFYTLNTPIKILLEYGVFGLLAYLGLLVAGTRTRGQMILLAPLLVLLLFTGGYHQFSPILFQVLLLADVALLRPDSGTVKKPQVTFLPRRS